MAPTTTLPRRARHAAALLFALALPLAACGGGGGSGGGSSGGGIGPLRGTVDTADVQYTIDQINAYRQTVAAPALVGNQQLHDFAVDGSQQLYNDHIPHKHFQDHSATLFTTDGFVNVAGENQGDPNGWPVRANVRAQIDEILAAMWAEGPGGGHHDNMASTAFFRVGIGLVLDPTGKLYFTNDFSG